MSFNEHLGLFYNYVNNIHKLMLYFSCFSFLSNISGIFSCYITSINGILMAVMFY